LKTSEPAYLSRLTTTELRRRADALLDLMRECILCPRSCKARRLDGKYGVCRTTDQVIISGASAHFGEEPPLVGRHGSGTIFFSSCNLKCLFCQNYSISHLREGRRVSPLQLAGLMMHLQQAGCHNINLVTPTHVVPQIVRALLFAVEQGLHLPLVYNCGGYESVQTLRMLDGIVDIYMPDIKYSDNDTARKYSGAADYWDAVRPAVKEMHRQVGELQTDARGVATRGLLIRHLVLPNGLAGSERVLKFIAAELSPDSYVNIMDQYRPAFRAGRMREVNRPITDAELDDVLDCARKSGLHRGFAF
jgi:putative pyruvate formate lyase activating enzyme